MTTWSAVVPVHGGAGFVGSCLRGLMNQSLPPSAIVVVDDASPDDTVDVVRRDFPAVATIGLERNRGFGAAVNSGMAATTTPWVAVINSDAVLEPTWAEVLLSEPPADDVWAVGGILLDPKTGLVESAGDCFLLDGRTAKWAAGCRRDHLPTQPYEVFAPPGAAVLIRRAAFDELGGYDSVYFLYYEDIDLAARARWLGWRAVVQPSAAATHGMGWSGRPRRSWYFISRNAPICSARNFPTFGVRRWLRVMGTGWRDARRRGYRAAFIAGRVASVPRLPAALVARRAAVRTADGAAVATWLTLPPRPC